MPLEPAQVTRAALIAVLVLLIVLLATAKWVVDGVAGCRRALVRQSPSFRRP